MFRRMFFRNFRSKKKTSSLEGGKDRAAPHPESRVEVSVVVVVVELVVVVVVVEVETW